MSEWTDTTLWGELRDRQEDAEHERQVVEHWLPKAAAVVEKGGTAPPDFTLHDQDHAYRVAELMTRCMPRGVLNELSPAELAVLLFAAYTHDVGMTPQLGLVRSVYERLLTGEDAPGENEELQRWLDDHHGVEVPIAAGTPTRETLRRAQLMTTHFVRHRHNAWSTMWIAQTFDGDPALFEGWLDDLTLVCASHHMSHDELRSDQFNPRLVGSGRVLHLRYCACLLRVADVLDFDPERTPDIIFRHRDITETSAIFWKKDQNIAFSINSSGAVLISARPDRAYIHRAIQQTVDQVEQELVGCRRVAEEHHLDRAPNIDEPLPHRWYLESHVRVDVEARAGAYEWIDGRFRPDTRKVLDLLGGVELYGDRRAAVRELLQNAFDAVRERIARQRLAADDPNNPDLVAAIRALNRVSLRLERRDESLWLSCTDTGIGMTKHLIVNRFLVSGASNRHEELDLERRCQARGFSVGRTARFGIGVLSYFLLAED